MGYLVLKRVAVLSIRSARFGSLIYRTFLLQSRYTRLRGML